MIRLLLVLACAIPALAADLELRYGALERLISEQVFTDDGRKWVRGSPKTHCQYAYLEHPHIGADGERLRIQARFSGRSAFNLLGGCVGLPANIRAALNSAWEAALRGLGSAM